MKKKLLAMFVAGAMILLAACSPAATPTDTTGDTATTDAATDDAADDAADDSAEAPPEREGLLDVTFVANVDQSIIDNVFGHIEDETWEDNRWTRRIAEDLGINVVYLWVANDQESFDLRLNMALASGDIPDILHLSNVQLAQAVAANLAADLGPLIDQHASPLLHRFIEETGPEAISATTFDGVQRGIGIGESIMETAPIMFIREDWRQQTGLPVPTTFDELFDLIEAFMEIAGDGAVGLAINNEVFGPHLGLNALLSAHGAYYNMWIERDGGLVYSSIQPEFKEALAMANMMFERGYFDIEFTVKDTGMVNEAIVGSLNGIYFGAAWTPLWPQPDSLANDPDANWYPHPVPTLDGSPPVVGVRSALDRFYIANSSFDHPEVLIQMINHYIKLAFDPVYNEYVPFMADPPAEGVFKMNPVHNAMESNKNPVTANSIAPHIISGDPTGLFGEQLTMWEFVMAGFDPENRLDMWGWNRIFGSGPDFTFPTGGSHLINYNALAEGRYVVNQFVGAPTPTMETHHTILYSALLEEFTKIVTGEEPLDHFYTAVESWLNSGGQAITDEVNEWWHGR